MKIYFFIYFFLLAFFNLFSQNFTTHPIDDDFGFARGIHVADLNNDGNLDIISLRIDTFVEIACWFGDGNGNFGNKTTIHKSQDEPISNLGDDLNVIDINNDGFLDVVSATQLRFDENTVSPSYYLAWWPNNKDNTFGEAIKIEEGVGNTSNSLLVFDVDNNNFDDIIIGDWPSGLDLLSYWANDGVGGVGTRQNILEIDVIAAHSALVNDDDFKDIVITSGGGGTGPRVALLVNNGDGTFGEPVVIDNQYTARYLTSGDINGDDNEDLLVSGLSNEESLVWYQGDGIGNFMPKQNILFNEGEIINGVEPFLADLDNDGDLDALLVTFSPYQLLWWSNDGNGNFSDKMTIDDTFSLGYGVEVIDLNGDGILDIVGTNDTGIYWFENNDMDNDGVANAIDVCPNTPIGALVDAKGCEVFSLAVNNFAVLTTGETCKSSNNGSISISATQILNYTATLIGAGVIDSKPFSDSIDFTNLSAGDYSICITVESQSSYEQCFNVTITEPEDLSVSSRVSNSLGKLSLTLKGGEKYMVTLNDRTFETEQSEIELDLTEQLNILSVKTDKDCQGIYEETFVRVTEAIVYPNPIKNNKLQIDLGKSFNEAIVNVKLYTIAGKLILSKTVEVENGHVQMNIESITSGMFLLKIITQKKILHYKIFKD